MPSWATWVLVGVVLWFVVSVLVALVVGAFIRVRRRRRRPRRARQGAERGRFEALAKARRSPLAAREPERERVLVVDDDPGLRLLLRTTLPASEFDVEEADSAEAAAETAQFFRPEVVILDVGLPGKDGLTFCRELKRSPRSPHVILLTGADIDARGATQRRGRRGRCGSRSARSSCSCSWTRSATRPSRLAAAHRLRRTSSS